MRGAVGAAGREKPARGPSRKHMSLQHISHPLIQEANLHHRHQSAKSAYRVSPILPEQEYFRVSTDI